MILIHHGEKKEDIAIDEYFVTVNKVEIKVDEFEVPNSPESRKIADFEYKGVHYQLTGVMEKTEFDKILENLYFFEKGVRLFEKSCLLNRRSDLKI